MQLNISGHHLDITPALKQHTNEKLSKIKHHFDQVMNVNMILEVQKVPLANYLPALVIGPALTWWWVV